ncbi:DUF4373 domain-containing protein [Sphingobacterium multivorum]|uniref:Lin1244/Lin1753 domain-containing protein n=1 Tax=Sphingobacterium multivorum TaxID=28454 RepID=UPI0019182297|nr:Lin1244/Lin1753 domain-containing protein [Sphingobacterium multivorum]QQT60061.1 DUF4373 domain-containing protein [Sphingobacterium multivorum]
MSKDTFYFSHDYGARNDPKLVKVLMKLGQEGKGVYWDLIEMLYEQSGYLMLSECDSYAFALRTTEACITRLVQEFGLFENDGIKFWSNSVLFRLNERNAKSLKAKQSAQKRWEKAELNANASKKNANALPSQSAPNAIKESKEKESKEKESIYIPTASGENEDTEQKGDQKPAWEQYSSNDFDTPKKDILNDQEFVSKLASNHVITVDKAKDWIENFFQNISFTGESKTSLQGYRKHCKNWINQQIQYHQKQNNNGTQNYRPGQRTSGRAPQGGYSPL